MPESNQKENLFNSFSSASLGFPSNGFGSDPHLEIAITSKHLRGSENHEDFNQFSSSNPISNPGIGLSVNTGLNEMGAPVRAETAIYKNSYGKPTAYIAASWQPLQAKLPEGLKAEFGAVVGLATGYTGHVPKNIEMGPVVPVVAPRLSIEDPSSGVAGNISVIPGLSPQDATAFCFSISKKF